VAFKLTKEELAGKSSLLEQLAKAKHTLELAVGDYNNELRALDEWANSVVERLEEEAGAKSESWQEGDKAEQVRSFITKFTDLDLSDLDITDDLKHGEAVEEIPDQPEEA